MQKCNASRYLSGLHKTKLCGNNDEYLRVLLVSILPSRAHVVLWLRARGTKDRETARLQLGNGIDASLPTCANKAIRPHGYPKFTNAILENGS